MKKLKTVGIKELKNNLSSYLREVRSGSTVLVSDRGDIVAELREPYSRINAAGPVNPLLLDWAQSGVVVAGLGPIRCCIASHARKKSSAGHLLQITERYFQTPARRRQEGVGRVTVIYLETSALLGWLLGEPCSREVKSKVDSAEAVATSVLTMIEAERIVFRAEALNILKAADSEKLRGLLARLGASWILMDISKDVRARASRSFPVEPIRTLDALHLATALLFMRVFPSLELFSYDQRILDNARVLGIKTA
jgi:hypothetical protein